MKVEKLKVWLLRPGEYPGANSNRLIMSFEKPNRLSDGSLSVYKWEKMPLDYLPEIKNGEYYEAEIVLGEKQ